MYGSRHNVRDRARIDSKLLSILALCEPTLLAAQTDDRNEAFRGSRFANDNIAISFGHIGDLSRTVSGGLQRSTDYLHLWSAAAEFDTEGLFGWRDSTIRIDVLGTTGGDPGIDSVGDIQGLNNIEADDGWKIYEAWYEQSLSGGRTSIKAGIFDLNLEFDVIDTGILFINSSHGMGPDFSQSGINGPSTFPTTAFGVRVRRQITDNIYLQGALLDGVPGDPETFTGTHIEVGGSDGALKAIEGGIVTATADGRRMKLALGAWRYSAGQSEDITRSPIAERNNAGLYALAEKSLFVEEADTAQGLAVFFRYGVADRALNPIESYLGAGLVYTGALPGRPEDQLGLAVAIAQGAQRQRADDPNLSRAETAWELTYRMPLTDWLTIQPNIQKIVDPGFSRTTGDALVVTMRAELTF